ncbi:MAG: hypothetical protein ACLUAR_16770 [Pilosibacter sp.]
MPATITLGSRVHIGYYDSGAPVSSTWKRPLFEESLRRSYPGICPTPRSASTLAAFLFTGDDVFKRIGDLERRRAGTQCRWPSSCSPRRTS